MQKNQSAREAVAILLERAGRLDAAEIRPEDYPDLETYLFLRLTGCSQLRRHQDAVRHGAEVLRKAGFPLELGLVRVSIYLEYLESNCRCVRDALKEVSAMVGGVEKRRSRVSSKDKKRSQSR